MDRITSRVTALAAGVVLALTVAACAQRDRGPDLAGVWFNANQDCAHLGYATMELRPNGSVRLQERTGVEYMHMLDGPLRDPWCASDIRETTEALNGDWTVDRDRLRVTLPTPVGNRELTLFYRVNGAALETARDAGFRDDLERFDRALRSRPPAGWYRAHHRIGAVPIRP